MPEFGESKTYIEEILIRLDRDEKFKAAHIARVTEKWDGDDWLFKGKVLQDVAADDLSGLFGDAAAKLIETMAINASLWASLDSKDAEILALKDELARKVAHLEGLVAEAAGRAMAAEKAVTDSAVKANQHEQVIIDLQAKLDKASAAVIAMSETISARDARIAELTTGQPAP